MKKTIIERRAENQAANYILEFIEGKVDSIREYHIIEGTADKPLNEWAKEHNRYYELVITALCDIADKL